jgi:hypothetical protein
VQFNFTTDQERIERANLIRAELQPHCDIVRGYDEEVRQLEAQLSSNAQRVSALLRRTTGGKLRCYIQEPEQFTLPIATQLARELEVQRREMDGSSQYRPAEKRPNFPNPALLAGKDIIGLIVDLAYVDDYKTAFLISWAVQNYLDTVAVPDSDTAKALYNVGVKVLSLDQGQPYSVSTNDGRGRSD